MSVITKDLGAATAYGYAVEKGYTGTEEEFAELMASYATVGQTVVDAKDAAVAAKTVAQTAATTATNKASEATTAAQTATTKAGEASTSASTATSAKDTAVSASQTATSKATEATTAAATATSAASTATTAKDDAVSAKTAAQTAQTGAETARDAVQSSAAQIATNASDITALKEDLTHAFPHDTVSGAVASFTDGADDVPMDSVIVSIEPVQSGNGDPSPDNVRPISGWSEVNVSACGINIWDEEWEVGGISSADGSKYNDKARIRSKNFISVEPSTQYYFAMPAALSQFKVVFYKQDKTFLSYSSYKNAVFTTPSDCYWLMLSENATDYGATYNHDISINYPSTDHEYHAYSGQSINIALGQTVYGGTLDVVSGVLTVDRKGIDLSTAGFNYNSGWGCWTNDSISDAKRVVDNNTAPDAICTFGVGVKASGYTTSHNHGTFTQNTSGLWLLDNDSSTTLTGTLVYLLATPLTVQLTPHEVRSLLGSNNVWADTGDSTVEYRADPTLYISRLTEPDADMIADANITSGSYFMVGNTLYKATANIASGATISPNVNCVRKSLSEALNEINA